MQVWEPWWGSQAREDLTRSNWPWASQGGEGKGCTCECGLGVLSWPCAHTLALGTLMGARRQRQNCGD